MLICIEEIFKLFVFSSEIDLLASDIKRKAYKYIWKTDSGSMAVNTCTNSWSKTKKVIYVFPLLDR